MGALVAGVELNMQDVIAVITDVFFQVRVAAAARAAGRTVRFSTSLDDLMQLTGADLVLVDLDAHLDVLSAIRSAPRTPHTAVIAFGPHIDTDGRKAARLAGADRVLAKSKFVTELPVLLRGDPKRLTG